MFTHLVGFEPDVEQQQELADFVPAAEASPDEIIDGQALTSDWLAELGAPDDEEITKEQEQKAAQEAFAVLTTNQTPQQQQEALLALKSRAGVQQLDAMLTTYDWEFVERAKELRSYTVAKILQETKHVDARIRLRALELLGKVTEVSLFTDRVEIKNTKVDDKELEDKIRERLERFMVMSGQLQDVIEVEKHEADGTGSA